MPQNIITEIELRHLAATPYQIINPGSNKPIIGIFQDSLLGSYRFTRKNIQFTPLQAMNLLMMYPHVQVDELRRLYEEDPSHLISNFNVLSQIMPPLTLKYKTGLFDEEEDPKTSNNVLEIRAGQYVRGQLEKGVFDAATKGILHRICNDFGNMACADFNDNMQNIVTEYMKTSSFSVGISDLIADRKTNEEIITCIKKQKMEVQTIIDKVHLGIFENKTANTNAVHFEQEVSNILNKATEHAGKIGKKSLSKDNRFLMIVESGSKGNLINISQMVSCLGQQSVDGKRISYGFDDRTLPHFKKYDDSPNARGFVENSYITGLSAPELFFHAMAGRTGLIDTAVKSVTRETPIVIIQEGKPLYTAIGDWIDGKLDDPENAGRITHYPNDRNMELLNIPEGVYIPTTDEDGRVTWGDVTAVTRHDPGERLYEITTESGRTVTVAESQSLLVWDTMQRKFLPKNCPEVQVGDNVPVTVSLGIPTNSSDKLVFYAKQEAENLLNGLFNVDLLFATNQVIYNIVDALFKLPEPTTIHVKTVEAMNGVSLLCSRVHLHVKLDFAACTVTMKSDYVPQNDVVLDPIVNIRVIGTEAHPKLYDLTIPSTLNFGLANGLQVRDTSSTGYIQRRLVKGLEDLMVNYDMTVRNNKGKIIQFQYGDDNFDATKVENQILPLIEMTVEDMYMYYDLPGMNEAENNIRLAVFTKAAVSRMNKQRVACKEQCLKYTERLMEARDLIVEKVFASQNEKSVRIPIAFQYIIANIQGQLHLDENSAVDITPLEAFKMIETYYERICAIPCVKVNRLIEIAYYYYLTPRDLLVKRRFHEKGLRLLLETIVLKFKEALVHPGEMVGVVAAQGCGEPTTQLSILRTEKIKMVRVNKMTQVPEMVSGEIGTLCDRIITQLPEYTFDTGHQDSVETVLEPLEDEYYIVGVDEKEQTHWNRISHVSRHIVNGDMIRVKTRSGRVVDTTMSHSHLVRKDQSVQPILGSDMTVGMRIPVAKHIDNAFVRDSVAIADHIHVLDREFGWFVGAYLAEGCLVKKKGSEEATGTISISNVSEYYIQLVGQFAGRFGRTCRTKSKTAPILGSAKSYTNLDTSFTFKPLADFLMSTCGTGSFKKRVPDFAFLAPDDFKAGLLAGYMDGDGNFMCDKLHHQIRVCSRSEQLIKDVSLLFGYLDIFGSLHTGYRNGANYYHLAISPKYAETYEERIGSHLHADKLRALVDYTKRTGVHSLREDTDRINGLGEVIAACGKTLELPGQSRLYRRWLKKDAIGRNTLEKYIQEFEQHDKAGLIQKELAVLKQAAYSHVVWDEIVEIERYTPDQTEYVYDFTVPGNQTFMTDYGVIVHNTLNTFHNTGVASKTGVTRGVPRIEEILRLTKNPKNPSMTVFMNPQEEMDIEKVNNYAVALTHTKLIDVVQSVQVYFDPMEQTTQIEEDRVLLEQFYQFEEMVAECMGEDGTAEPGAEPAKSKWVIRMEIDKEILIEKNLTMDDIHFAVANSHYGKDVHCVFSDYNMDKLVFRIRTNANIFDKKPKRGVANPLDQSDEIYLLKNFQDALLNQIVLRGIHGVKNVLSRKLQNTVFKEEGKYVRKDTWVLDSTGSNLLDTLALDFIDATRTTTNDIKEVFDVLGIEAARKCIHTELVDVMAAAGASINYHHTSLLCDRMTCNKDMVSIFRSGLLNDNVGPIAKATFEVHTEVFLDAARHAEFDHMKGVSANIMCGQQGDYGTNAFQVVLDMKAYESLKGAAYQRRDVNREIEEGLVAPTDDTTCGTRMEIQNNIASIRRTTDHAAACLDDGYDIGF
jgi:DNA-directed RNA polymerase beta' subunit